MTTTDPTIPTQHETRTQEQIQRIIDLVRSKFDVVQEYLREGEAMEFFLGEKQEDTKSRFVSLVSELRNTGDTAALRKTTGHGLLLIVFKKPAYPRQRLRTPVILLLATILTVFADGVIRAVYSSDPATPSVSLSDGMNIGILYAASVMGILGVHELGHKVAAWHHKMGSTWPYFIPGIPSIFPTFGAVIRSWDPPINRDALFDLGLSGPVAGLLVTLVVSVFAVGSAKLIPVSSLPPNSLVNVDVFTTYLINALKTSSPNYAVGGTTFSLLYFAYSIGFVITFLNLLPAWQLDGGHIANSAVSPKVHRWLTYVSALVMVLIGFYPMAFLVLILGTRAPSLRPLDDVSVLSAKRKIFFVLTWVLSGLIFFFVVYHNFFFGSQMLF